MPTYTVRATRNDKPRKAEANTREQAELIAAAWWSDGWRAITINFEMWVPAE